MKKRNALKAALVASGIILGMTEIAFTMNNDALQTLAVVLIVLGFAI